MAHEDETRSDVLSELRQLGTSIKEDFRECMEDFGSRLRENVRHDTKKILHSCMTSANGVRAPWMDDPCLRSSAWTPPSVPQIAVEHHSFGKLGNLAIRPESGSKLNARKHPPVAKPCISDLSATQPDDSPPLLPSSVPDSDNEKLPVGDYVAAGQASSYLHVPQAGSVKPITNFPKVVAFAKNGDVANDGQCSEESTSFRSEVESWRGGNAPTIDGGGRFQSVVLREQQIKINNRESRARISISRERARVDAKTKAEKPVCQMSVSELIRTPLFDNIVGSIILLNAAVIGCQTDYNAREQTDHVPLVFYIFEQFFAAWFTLELVLRIYVFKCRFFKPCSEGWVWNYFDFFVVMAQLLEVFFELVARSSSIDAGNFRVLRVLRILRLVRILRVVRVLHLISELRTIVSSIVGSFRSLVWVVVLLLLMIYIVAVFFTQSITDVVVELKKDGKSFDKDEGLTTLTEYFGSLGRAILSLWQAMSGGLDWDTLAWPLFKDISITTGFAFAAFIAFALLALMNVVTGVFVQTALLSAREEEDSFMASQIIALFNIADKDGSATISWQEIVESLDDPQMAKEWKSIGVQAADARYLFKLLDLEGKGEVAFEEFMGGCLRLSGGAKAIDVLTIMQEARKNEDKSEQNWEALTTALVDVHETVKNSQADISTLTKDVSHLGQRMNQITSEFARISYTIGAECDGIKKTLAPLILLHDLVNEDSSNPPDGGGATLV